MGGTNMKDVLEGRNDVICMIIGSLYNCSL